MIFLSISAMMDRNIRNESISDGPYVFLNENRLVIKWIKNGSLHRKTLKRKNFDLFKDKFDFKFGFSDLNENPIKNLPDKQSFNGIDSVCAVSDIHGEFKSYIRLMKAQGIIDDDLNWNFGTGHLIILGDYFDRGNMVTELIWHLFGLEKQAEKAGGKVHIMLGNHELMMFSNDTRYTNDKYLKVSDIIGQKYSDLYSMNTFMGKWLRSKPVIISINNCLFVHGGISGEMLQKNMETEKINALFSKLTQGKMLKDEGELHDLLFLTENEGPVWYRGFFEDPGFTEARADSILAFYGMKHIIVGHTSDNEMKVLFNNKILCIDAGLGNNEPGIALICKNNAFFKGTADGRRVRF
jgi:hypothetical protein